ncbi:hypothetical protein ACA910_007562 [Epithemia clementina (nom. ined.)]
MANTFGRRDWTRGAVDHDIRVEKDADNNPWHFINGGLLEAARPPDSIFGSPQWRWCHMGLILSAEGPPPTEITGTRSRLFILMDLYDTGVRTVHLLVTGSLTQKKIKDFVSDQCNQ